MCLLVEGSIKGKCTKDTNRICCWSDDSCFNLELAYTPGIEQESSKGKLAVLPAFIGFWLGMLFLLFLDSVIPHLHQFDKEAEGIQKHSIGKITMMILDVMLD